MNRLRTILLCVAILCAAGIGIVVIYNTEPTATRETATRESAMLVDVVPVERGDHHPRIVATGTVTPAREIQLSPRVSGEIIERADAFTPGGIVEKGTRLLLIDPADYKNALRQRESELRQARTDLKLEQGRQSIARQDFEMLDESINTDSRALVLREPQLAAARVAVDAAEAAVEQARLQLDRTRIHAPFDAHILERNVNLGSQVAPGDNLGHLVGIDEYWISVTVPLSKLRWIRFPESPGDKGAPVRIRNRTAWAEDVSREGRIHKLIGALDENARMARLLVRVTDPLARETDDPEVPRFIIGAYVHVRIQGEKLENVVRLRRDYLRKDETVWVMDEKGQLSIRAVDIVFGGETHAYIREGLDDGERVVTTNLSTVIDGADLRLGGESNGTGVSVPENGNP